MRKVAKHFHNKKKMFISLTLLMFNQPNKESGKILNNDAEEPYLEPCQISMMKYFSENTTAKNFVIDI